MAEPRNVVVYDGECPFCCEQVARIRQRDRAGRFEFVARQAPGITERFPALAEGDFNTGMRLVRPDGRIYVGADAVYEIARRLPRWRWFAWLYRIPGIHALCRWIYAWIAANRLRLGRTCAGGVCRIGQPHSATNHRTPADR
jgi:predicted DCC family thiol-disulfide oxidoreductase YuxK